MARLRDDQSPDQTDTRAREGKEALGGDAPNVTIDSTRRLRLAGIVFAALAVVVLLVWLIAAI